MSPSSRSTLGEPAERTGADRARLRRDLTNLGVPRGAAVLVHSSLRSVRPEAGAPALVAALLDVLGEHGTLLVPTQTAGNSPTSPQYLAATAGLSREQARAYRDSLAGFDPATTPSSGMGAVAEYVRTLPQAARSAHPHSSFAAVGGRARQLTAIHDLACHLGERSPLGSLYRADGWILHLGTGFQTSTIFHLAEYRYAALPARTYEACLAAAGGRGGPGLWTAFEDIELRDGDFAALGSHFEACSGAVRRGRVGCAPALLFPARAGTDHAVGWMRRERRQCAVR